MKPVNQKAWWLILPVVLCVAFSAVLPLMTVVNYSVQDIISPERRIFVISGSTAENATHSTTGRISHQAF